MTLTDKSEPVRTSPTWNIRKEGKGRIVQANDYFYETDPQKRRENQEALEKEFQERMERRAARQEELKKKQSSVSRSWYMRDVGVWNDRRDEPWLILGYREESKEEFNRLSADMQKILKNAWKMLCEHERRVYVTEVENERLTEAFLLLKVQVEEHDTQLRAALEVIRQMVTKVG